VGKIPEAVASARAAKVDEVLALMKNGYLALPAGSDIVEFVRRGGQVQHDEPSPPTEAPSLDLTALRDRYVAAHSLSLEANSLDTCKLHLSHLIATLGGRFPAPSLSASDLQLHIDRRAKLGTRAVTLRKEIATYSAVWNWACRMQFLPEARFPSRGLRYPTEEEKLPFMTWDEVGRRLAQGGDPSSLWEALYLQTHEIEELLDYVKGRANQPFLYPMFVTAAHTGARRSEMMRAERQDVDLAEGVITLREKKRRKGKQTNRRVPLSKRLGEALADWLADHPGGPFLFCQAEGKTRNGKRRLGPEPLTRTEAHDHFKRTLAGTKWAVLRGYHVLRHSFISACASKGIDQRLIDEWAGHSTEEQRRRYRHLYPSTQRQAIRSGFGEGQ
jgi:integrase